MSGRRIAAAGLVVMILAAGLVAFLAARHNSVTFDEPYMISSGARGWATGDWTMTIDHPPLLQYLYGAAAQAAGIRLPEEGTAVITLFEERLHSFPTVVLDTIAPGERYEAATAGDSADGGTPVIETPDSATAEQWMVRVPRWRSHNRYPYARLTFFETGNDPQRLAMAARVVAVLFALGIGAAVAVFTWTRFGPVAALLATPLTVFLPDVLAHAGVAYNDLPVAFIFFVCIWAWDTAIRRPTPRTAAVAAALSAVAIGIKYSALSIGAVAFILFVMEWAARDEKEDWLRRIGRLLPPAILVTYLGLVVIFRGDFTLEPFRQGLEFMFQHVSRGHGVAYLLGHASKEGAWYFFPVLLVLKTPVALHILAALAVAGHVLHHRRTGPDRRGQWLRSPIRPMAAGALVFLAFLMRSQVNIGIRHALPLMPLVTVMIGVGVARLLDVGGRNLRAGAIGLVGAFVVSSLLYYPFFLTYLTEYVPDRRDAGHRVVADSNLDWGQGLIALHDWMEEHDVDGVHLSYFGSALPAGYGIRYLPMPSMLELPRPDSAWLPPTEPKWIVVSATHLRGLYLYGDIFASLRRVRPRAVIANSLYVFRLEDDAGSDAVPSGARTPAARGAGAPGPDSTGSDTRGRDPAPAASPPGETPP